MYVMMYVMFGWMTKDKWEKWIEGSSQPTVCVCAWTHGATVALLCDGLSDAVNAICLHNIIIHPAFELTWQKTPLSLSLNGSCRLLPSDGDCHGDRFHTWKSEQVSFELCTCQPVARRATNLIMYFMYDYNGHSIWSKGCLNWIYFWSVLVVLLRNTLQHLWSQFSPFSSFLI